MRQKVDVLLVDDDRDICVMVEAILMYAGYTVQSCCVPDQFFKLLNETDPGLLLMDMLLSGIDGRDVCRRLKADVATSHLKILMMSAHPEAAASCRNAGADDFVAKPFDMDYFISRVKNQLTGSR